MAEKNASVTKRSASGTISLIIRQIVVQSLNFGGNLCLARFLSVNDYGFYGIVFFVLSFVLNFGDIGLAPSLIHQTSPPSKADRDCVFTVQLVLSLLLAISLSSAAPFLCRYYKIDQSYSIFFHFISITVFLLSFKSVPTVMLERDISFGWLTLIEILQAFIYNAIACILAFYKWGAYSFSIALLVRTLLGTILVNLVHKNIFCISLKLANIKTHLKFGIPFQMGVLINVIKDSISPVVVGSRMGIKMTGIVNMASLVGAFPSMLLFVMNRLFFPMFSRAKGNPQELQFLFKIAIRISNAISAITAIYVLFMCKPVIMYVFGEKWLPAQNLVYFFWTANLTLPSMLVCISFLNALGLPKISMRYNILWMFLTLSIGIPLIYPLGIYGVGIANVVVNLSMLLVYFEAQKRVRCSILKEMFYSWLPSLPAVAALWLISRSNPVVNLHSLILQYIPFFLVYSAVFIVISKNEISAFFARLKSKPAEEYSF
jgi:O-antigen/teichoic acid export membrane protein